MILSVNESIKSSDDFFTLEKEESRHLIKILRKSKGDIIHITDGKGHLFTVEISKADEKKSEIKILNVEKKEKMNKFNLHIAIAPTKSNDRFEWFLEKSVEIGINQITPIFCEYSERKTLKIDRMNKIILSAVKQSLQFYIPVLNDPIPFEDFIKIGDSSQKFIAHCEDDSRKKLLQDAIHSKNNNLLVLIGPEGDFSKKEIQSALDLKFIPVTLSKNRLRTETAAIYASCLTSLL